MKNILLILLALAALQLYAQPSDATVLRLLDSYDLVPADAPQESTMYPGEGLSVREGSFIIEGREEYLAVVPLAKGPKTSQIAFITWEDEEGAWQRSAWFELGFKAIRPVNLMQDALDEIILETAYIGRNRTLSSLKLLSVKDDERKEYYSVEGFELDEEAMLSAEEGEHLSSMFTVDFRDVNEDGRLEIVESVEDAYRVFSYYNIKTDQEYDEDNEPVLPGVEQKTTIFKIKDGELIEMKLKEREKEHLE
jgi:hypothetical protein